MTVEELDRAPAGIAAAALLRCCGARAWADAMLAARPLRTTAALHEAADRSCASLAERDWREAFAAHPRIGERAPAAATQAGTSDWSGREQAGAAAAGAEVRAALAQGNAEYEARFGHTFIVCATGLSADEMLAMLRARLGHSPQAELRVAAEEQRRIMHLRIDKLLGEGT